MPVMSIGEIKYMITLYKTSITISVLEILDWKFLQAIWGRFRENWDWNLGRISAQIG